MILTGTRAVMHGGIVLIVVCWSVVAHAECRLTWEVPPGTITGYRLYVSSVLQEVQDRVVAPVETAQPEILCATASVDLDDYAAVSAYDSAGNESPLSNVVRRKNLVNPVNVRVRHFIEVTE